MKKQTSNNNYNNSSSSKQSPLPLPQAQPPSNNSDNEWFSLEKYLLDYKGYTSTYRFTIPYSNFSEPLIVTLYERNEGGFLKNLYFDKNLLCKFLKIQTAASNGAVYKEENIKRYN